MYSRFLSTLQLSDCRFKCVVIDTLSNVFHDQFTYSCFFAFPRPALNLKASLFASIVTKSATKDCETSLFLEKLILNPYHITLKRSWYRRLWWHFFGKKKKKKRIDADHCFLLIQHCFDPKFVSKGLKDNFTNYCASMSSNDPWSVGKLMETDGMILFPMIILHSYKLVFSLFAFRNSLSDLRMQ